MNRIEFDNLVAKVEARHRDDIPSLRRKALFLAIAGYAIIALTILIAVGVLAASVLLVVKIPKLGIFLAIWALVMLWRLFNSLWVRIGDPEGMEVRRDDAPKLFSMIDEVGGAAGEVRIHRIVITPDFNAAVQSNPQLGAFGWHRLNLILGAPLLHVLSTEEFKSVLAHEFGHLGRRHGRLGNWIYRTRMTWERIAQHLLASGSTTLFLRPFFLWFWPRFNALAFVLSRSNEYEADAFAARITSPETTGATLTRIALGARQLHEEFWPAITARVRNEPTPPADVMESMAYFLARGPQAESGAKWLNQELAMTTGTSDTHPGLKDRLAAIGATAAPHEPILKSAPATTLFNLDFVDSASRRFSGEWAARVETDWKRNHAEVTKLSILSTEGKGPEDEPSLWKQIVNINGIEGTTAAQPFVMQLLALNPEHTGAKMLRGKWLVEQDDESGIPLLEHAAKDFDYTIDSLGAMALFHDRRGNPGLIREIKKRADIYEELMGRIAKELNNLSSKMTLLPNDYPHDKTSGLIAILASFPEVKKASLARRNLPLWPDKKVYVLALDIRYPWYKLVSESAYGKLVEKVVDMLPEDGCIIQVIPKVGSLKSACTSVAKIQASQIFERHN